MKRILFFAFCSSLTLSSCNNSAKETTKENEEIKVDTAKVADDKKTEETEEKELNFDALKFPGSVAYAVFLKDGKTIFYYNVDTEKGEISIDGKKYKFDSYKHYINEADFLIKSGKELTITVNGISWEDYENPEPGILKGKAASVKIKLGDKEYVYDNAFDVVDGTNAD